MKNLLVIAALLFAAPAQAGKFYDLVASVSSATLRLAGVIQVNDPSAPYTTKITINGVDGAITATSFSGALNGSSLVNTTVTSAKMTTTISANSCGSATAVPVITYDAAGRLTACTPTTISGATQWATSGNNISYLTNGGIVQIGKYSGLGAKLHVGGSSLDGAAQSLAMVSISTQSSGYPGLTSVLAMRLSNNAGSAGTRTNIVISGNDETNLKSPSSYFAGTWLSGMEGRADVAGRNFAQSFDIAVATGYRPGFGFTHVGLGTGDPKTAVGGPVFEIGYGYFDDEVAATRKANPGPAHASFGVFQDLNSPGYAVVVSSKDASVLHAVRSDGVVFQPSQARAILTKNNAMTCPAATTCPIFWDSAVKVTNMTYDIVNSSSIVTVPTGSGGAYSLYCSAVFQSATPGTDYIYVVITVNSTDVKHGNGAPTLGSQGVTISADYPSYELAAGDTVKCSVRTSLAGGTTVDNATSRCSVKKL